MSVNVSVPVNTDVTSLAIANSDNNFQRVTIEWDNGNGPTDTYTTTSVPPYDNVEFGGATRNSGSSGVIKVTVEHSSNGTTNWQASEMRLKELSPSGEAEVQSNEDDPPPEPWDDTIAKFTW
ncbi:MAG: hypothetical protein O7H41_14340 [Planctomycetota bacterium]|nr:hypothetical protein [Planctomycetota bacterium]